MDSNSSNCSPSAHPTSAAVQIWSANSANNCSDEHPQHQQIEIDNSPECSHNEEGNVFSHHHQEVNEVADYSQNHVSHASSSNMYDTSEVKLSPSTSDLEPHSLNHAHSGHYEEGLQVYSQQNNNGDEEVSEIPSTTTDQPQERVVAHELKHYVSQQPPNSSEDILKSYHQSCHHHHNHDHRHHLNAFSPQPPTSSTSDYQVHLENYDDTSHLITYNSPPEPDSQDHHYDQRTNERNLEVGDGSTSSEVSIPVSVSSSDVLSSSNIVRDPSPSHNEVLQVVSDSHSYASAINEVGTIQEPNESLHESSSHQLNSHIIQDDISAINMHREGSPLENGAHSTAPYYSHESLDPSLVHLVNQRFTSLMGSGIVSLPPHKELLVESVVRSMIGTQPGRLYSTDLRSENVLNDIDSSRLSEDPETSLSVKEMVVSSMANDVLEVDRTFPVVSVSGTLHVEPSILSNAILDERALTSLPSGSRVTTVLTNSLPRGLLTLAPGSVPLELVGGNILVGHSIVEPRPSTSQIIHPPREATPGIVSSLNGVSNVITTTAVIHERELSSVDSLVQVSHISEATPIQNYVSSSTGGLENEAHDLSSHTIILDTTVDSTVGTSDVSHLEHAKGLVGSTSEHYISEVDHQEAVALKYPSDVDVDHYSVVSTHDDQLDSGHGVSTTAEIIDQERGILLISSGDSRMNNVLSSPSTATTTTIHVPIPISESVDGALSSSSIASESLMSTTSIPDNQQTLAFSRPRRYLAKQRSSKNNDVFDHGIWCEECNICYENGCPKHRVQTIYDKPVQTRARASLPASYLSINKVSVGNDGEPVYGVFAKKMITKRTQFGPLEGVPVKKEEPLSHSPNMLVMQIESETGEFVNLDTSDEGLSNWMRFVRPAEHYREQNLIIFQQGQSLYYTSTRNIMPRTELKVGYSTQYASQRNLRVLEPDAEMKAEEEQENSWPCFECNRRFLSSEDLQQHLNDHDITEAPIECEIVEEIEDDSCTSRKRGRPKNKVPKKIKGRGVPKKFKVALDSLNDATNEALSKRPRGRPPKKFRLAGCSGQEMFECNLCQKVFPRQYSLQRHQAMHSGEKKFKCSICEMKFTHVYNRNRHMRRHRNTASGDVEAFKPIKSLFKKKQAGGSEWLCTHCDLTFDNASLLNLHTLTHAAEDVGLTEFSKFPVGPVLSSKDDDLRDAGFENGDIVQNENLQCPECTQDFHTRKELIDHASTHGKVVTRKSFRGIINPAKPYKCELCYKSFATEDRLQRHMLVHGNEDAKPLQCSVCDKRFLNNSALACHIKVHSDEKKCYECPICKEEFDQIVSLKEHIRIHSINGLFTCPTCQKTFEEYNQIRKHIRAFHSEKKFPCEHCDKIFPRPDKLKLHMLRHSNHREFLCANCGKQFKRKDKLKEHMKRMHSAEREARLAAKPTKNPSSKKFIPKVSPTDYHRFIYKCHACLLGFKRRGMLVNHLAKRHPDIRPESVPELNLPILKTTRDYYCQYCDKVYKSSSKRKAHILKQHPGAELPMSNRRKGGIPEIPGLPNPTFSQTVGSITTHPHNCEWCHKQYASKAKLLQHQRKKHLELLPHVNIDSQQVPRTHLRDQGHKHVEQQTAQYITVPAAALVHQQITATTQTSEMEFDDGTAVVIADIKPKIITTIAGTTTSIYMDQEDGTSAVVVSASDLTNQTASVDALPPADLLTQAMSELTQSLTDYRPSNQDYQLARVTQSCPPTVLVPSPSSTPISTSATSSHVTIEQTQLGQLLGHYESSEQAPQSPLDNSPQQVAITTHSSTFVPRTWASTYTDYPAR